MMDIQMQHRIEERQHQYHVFQEIQNARHRVVDKVRDAQRCEYYYIYYPYYKRLLEVHFYPFKIIAHKENGLFPEERAQYVYETGCCRTSAPEYREEHRYDKADQKIHRHRDVSGVKLGKPLPGGLKRVHDRLAVAELVRDQSRKQEYDREGGQQRYDIEKV